MTRSASPLLVASRRLPASFAEFYGWLSNPDRARSARSGFGARLLKAKLMSRHYKRKAVAAKNKAVSQRVVVADDPTVATVHAAVSFGTVDPDTAASSLALETRMGDGAPERPARMTAEDSPIVFALNFALKEGADLDISTFRANVEAFLVIVDLKDTLDAVGARLIVAEREHGRTVSIVVSMSQNPVDEMSAVFGGEDPVKKILKSIRLAVCSNKSPESVAAGEEGAFADVAARIDFDAAFRVDGVRAVADLMGMMGSSEMAVPFKLLAALKAFRFDLETTSVLDLVKAIPSDDWDEQGMGDAMAGFSGQLAYRMMNKGLAEAFGDEDFPPFAKALYAEVQAKISEFTGFELWYTADLYTSLRLRGFSTAVRAGHAATLASDCERTDGPVLCSSPSRRPFVFSLVLPLPLVPSHRCSSPPRSSPRLQPRPRPRATARARTRARAGAKASRRTRNPRAGRRRRRRVDGRIGAHAPRSAAASGQSRWS